MKKLYGVITAMVTPFDENDKVNLKAVEELTEFLISKKVNCLYPCGTTGEMHLMSVEEREAVAETVVKTAKGRVTVYIHVGAMTTADTVRLAKHAHSIGADGIGCVTPSYFGSSERATEEFFTDVANSVPADFPIYLYSIPQCAGNDISPALAERLALKCPNIIGIKYSYADMHRLCEYRRVNGGKFSVVAGPDRLFLPALSIGCDGTVSGVSCPMAEPFVNLYDAYLKGDMEKAQHWHNVANDCVIALKAGSDMGIFKAVLHERGLPKMYMRKPLLNLTNEQEKEYASLTKELEKML